MTNERVFALVFASVYPHYLKKTETKGRTKEELDEIDAIAPKGIAVGDRYPETMMGPINK